VFHATAHQTIAVGVAASLRTAVPQRLLVLKETLALLPAEGAHLPRAVGGRGRHLKAEGTGLVGTSLLLLVTLLCWVLSIVFKVTGRGGP
jgi:hypothetical protein